MNRVTTTTQSSFGKKSKKALQAKVMEKLQAQQMNPGQAQYEGPTERPWGP